MLMGKQNTKLKLEIVLFKKYIIRMSTKSNLVKFRNFRWNIIYHSLSMIVVHTLFLSEKSDNYRKCIYSLYFYSIKRNCSLKTNILSQTFKADSQINENKNEQIQLLTWLECHYFLKPIAIKHKHFKRFIANRRIVLSFFFWLTKWGDKTMCHLQAWDIWPECVS